jgi:hypothetical protein
MRLEPLYTITFTTPEAWSVEAAADAGIEGRSFLLAEGRSTGRLSARYRAANFPRKRADAALVPEFRGVLETDDGVAILFEWQGLAVISGVVRGSGCRGPRGTSGRGSVPSVVEYWRDMPMRPSRPSHFCAVRLSGQRACPACTRRRWRDARALPWFNLHRGLR